MFFGACHRAINWLLNSIAAAIFLTQVCATMIGSGWHNDVRAVFYTCRCMSFRILHCISSVNPAGGGPIEGLKQLAAVNHRRGHTIEVASLDDPRSDWVRKSPVPCHALGPGVSAYQYSSRFVPWLRSNRHRYDAVIVDGLWQYHAFGTWRALKDSSTPYFVFTHGMLDPWFKHTFPLKHLKKWMFWPWADYRVLRDARAVLFTCEQERVLARQSFWHYRCNERVVSFGTSNPPGDADEQKARFYQQFPHLIGKRCVLFLGRVHPKKGPDLLFKAFAALLARLPEPIAKTLHIVMAGPADDAYAAQMKELVLALGLTEHVTWTGMVTGDMKWGAFRAAEAFVLPSHQENFGIAVAEAMACARPVLISNQVNIWPEIQADGAGWVESDDVAGTERLLSRWVHADEQQLAEAGERARASFQQRFFIDSAAQSLIDTLEELNVRGSGADTRHELRVA